MASKTWLLASTFLTITTHFAFVTSQYEYSDCLDKGSYTNESLYRTDLITLLRSLSSNIGINGFYATSVGDANTFALCRADIQHDQCRGCVNLVAEQIQQQCPYQLQAVMWQQYCMVLYSNESIFGRLTANESMGTDFDIRIGSVRNREEYYRVRGMLINDLGVEAARGGDLLKAAAGNRSAPDNQTIYAMVQCRPDLSPENCRRCLVNATGELSGCCDYLSGYVVYKPSCSIRYETDSLFYNVTRLREPLVSPSSSPRVSGNDDHNRTRNIIIIVVSIVVFLIVALFIGIFTRKRIKQEEEEELETIEDGDKIRSFEFKRYKFHKIRAATNNFSDKNKLGYGGFGSVYKGKLKKGQEIAVKRLTLNSSGQGDREFKTEVLFLAKLQHKNLVRLLGFSLKGTERLLIYEFVQNGSLDNFLSDPIKSSNLKWEARYKIIGGVAEGLLYLHEDFKRPIIHRDLKASNVLLDKEMNPKISDFGLAKLVVGDATHGHTSRVVGTTWYMPPEYVNQGELSIKFDIFSFGVLLLEIVTGEKISRQNEGNEPGNNLLSRARRSWTDTKGASMIDTSLMVNSGDHHDMLRCFHIALLCVQRNPTVRPKMDEVVEMLKGSPPTLPSPSDPGFYIPSVFYQAQELNISSEKQ